MNRVGRRSGLGTKLLAHMYLYVQEHVLLLPKAVRRGCPHLLVQEHVAPVPDPGSNANPNPNPDPKTVWYRSTHRPRLTLFITLTLKPFFAGARIALALRMAVSVAGPIRSRLRQPTPRTALLCARRQRRAQRLECVALLGRGVCVSTRMGRRPHQCGCNR